MLKNIAFLILILFLNFFTVSNLSAYWVWTPESKKWTNPKYATKDFPKDQFDWSMDFFTKKNYKRAIKEFRKLVDNFPRSKYAAEAQFYIGESYMEFKKYYTAYLEYQKAIEKYPGTKRINDIIERQLQIANHYYYAKEKSFAGITIPKDYSICIDIYSQIVKSAPYADKADHAQFFLAESYRAIGKFEEAIDAYNKLIDKYSSSKFIVEAKYKIALSHSSGSLGASYDSKETEKAIDEFTEFSKKHGETARAVEAKQEMGDLQNKNAEKIYDIARFYERGGNYDAALLYYEDIIKKYPETVYGKKAQDRSAIIYKKHGSNI